MLNSAFAASCFRRACILVFLAITVLFIAVASAAAPQSKSPGVLPAPAAGKAVICIYRVSRFTGSASHDEVFVNDTHLGKLLNGEYEFLEVPAGTVVIAGLPKMYYGSAIMSAGAALVQARQKENERARFEAEAGKTYYFKWTAGTMGTDIKVTPVDPSVGVKEMSKLHLSKPPDDTNPAEAKETATPAPK